MSVRKGDQDEGKLRVIDSMRILLGYTYDRMKDKTFPKGERWIMAKAIWDSCVAAHANILKANSIRVKNPLEAQERILAEEIAIGSLDTMISLIDTCHMTNTISDDRADYWTGLATSTQNIAKAWLKSQAEQYKEFLHQK